MKPTTQLNRLNLHLLTTLGLSHDSAEIVMDRISELEAEVKSLREDKRRLDWLESCRRQLNTECGSSYGWQVIRSHLVNRLMFRTPEVCEMAGIDVNDTGHPGTSIRDAIDSARKTS